MNANWARPPLHHTNIPPALQTALQRMRAATDNYKRDATNSQRNTS
ncbi:hypothetical protein F7734_50605 [Scytonema sp. UIC 10036]|nr:hypothetical protein [Scytonema sp. UIC 10036]MUH00094.1 hypothetical protein [Scytonema sp. UIC 10036]